MLELTHEFCKAAGEKVNTQTSIMFLYMNNDDPKRNLKKNFIYNSIKKNELLTNKFKQEENL